MAGTAPTPPATMDSNKVATITSPPEGYTTMKTLVVVLGVVVFVLLLILAWLLLWARRRGSNSGGPT